MTEPDIWRMPNGNPLTSFETSTGVVRFEEHYPIGYRGDAFCETHYHDELPAGAVPLVALPTMAVHRDDDGNIVASDRPDSHFFTVKTSVEAGVAARELLARVSQMFAVQRLLEQEEATVEAARRRVLADFQPGIYRCHTNFGYRHAIVCSDGRLFMAFDGAGRFTDLTHMYPQEEWSFDLLAAGDLSSVVTG